MNNNLTIYRLCRDQATINRIMDENKDYGLNSSVLITGPDYFEFLQNILTDCKTEFALVCHDDVVLPLSIDRRVQECIKKADQEFGEERWGVVGNAGIEFLTNEVVRFVRDPHSAIIPADSRPIPVVAIDGNTLLLNLKNLKNKEVKMPKILSGFHFYDTALLIETYRSGLIVAVDPTLYVYHLSGGNQLQFDKEAKKGNFRKYWASLFVNHTVLTLNGLVEIEIEPSYLIPGSGDGRKDFYQLAEEVIDKAYNKEKPFVYIITRTQLRRINILERLLVAYRMTTNFNKEDINFCLLLVVNNTGLDEEKTKKIVEEIQTKYSDLNIKIIIEKNNSKKFPRVNAISSALREVDDQNSYIWIVDDDDFMLPEGLKKLEKFFDGKTILMGNVLCFEEKWNDFDQYPTSSIAKVNFFNPQNYHKGVFGDNHVPVTAVLFPFKVLEKIFKKFDLEGDYYEDYAIVMLSRNYAEIKFYPVYISGVSYHGGNTVLENNRTHWNYSLITFLSEMVNSGTIKKWEYDSNISREPFEKELMELRARFSRWHSLIRIARPIVRFAKKTKILKISNSILGEPFKKQSNFSNPKISSNQAKKKGNKTAK